MTFRHCFLLSIDLYTTRFNPIAATLLKRALQALLAKTRTKCTSTAMLDIVVESANGDIRSAIMALQLMSAADSSSSLAPKALKASSKKGRDNVHLLESITRREQSLVLFHLMGKILYAKRKGDPASSSASKRDIERERELDKKLKDPPDCPNWLNDHDRRASRVDVDVTISTPLNLPSLRLIDHDHRLSMQIHP